MSPQVSDSRDSTFSVNMVSNETSEYYASLYIQSALILPQIQGWKCGDSIGNLYLTLKVVVHFSFVLSVFCCSHLPFILSSVSFVFIFFAEDGYFPGVIDSFGGIGGLIEIQASLLASHGFGAMALAYYNYEDLPFRVEKVDLEYFEEAVNFVLRHTKVNFVFLVSFGP